MYIQHRSVIHIIIPSTHNVTSMGHDVSSMDQVRYSVIMGSVNVIWQRRNTKTVALTGGNVLAKYLG